MNDESQIAADAHRPEVRISRFAQPVELHARTGGIKLEIERGRLRELLLIAGESGETVGEGVGDSEVHGKSTLNEIRGLRES
jgi:hypothetical protein